MYSSSRGLLFPSLTGAIFVDEGLSKLTPKVLSPQRMEGMFKHGSNIGDDDGDC